MSRNDRQGEKQFILDQTEQLQRLFTHFQLVRRTIGVDASVKALDGLPTRVLPGRMTQPLFPALWRVRVEMTARWRREGGPVPGGPRHTAEHVAQHVEGGDPAP